MIPAPLRLCAVGCHSHSGSVSYRKWVAAEHYYAACGSAGADVLIRQRFNPMRR